VEIEFFQQILNFQHIFIQIWDRPDTKQLSQRISDQHSDLFENGGEHILKHFDK